MATNFFQRWSQRKLHCDDEASLEQPDEACPDQAQAVPPGAADNPLATTDTESGEKTATSQPASEQTGSPLGGGEAEPVLTLADVAKVTFDSGVSSFMKEGVEKSVKKAALRKLFHSDEFNYISDMDDHTEDFSNVPSLDTSVTQQLRQWVNKVADVADDMLEEASTASPHPQTASSSVQQEKAEPGDKSDSGPADEDPDNLQQS